MGVRGEHVPKKKSALCSGWGLCKTAVKRFQENKEREHSTLLWQSLLSFRLVFCHGKVKKLTLAELTSETPTPRVVGMMQNMVRPVAKAIGVNGSLMVAHPHKGVIPASKDYHPKFPSPRVFFMHILLC
jgi:hypothetical protein